MKATKNAGFTLIELLIVIGLLGALTALVLPSLSGNRTEAIASICDYNQAGTVRTLKQFEDMYDAYPKGFHTGLVAAGGTAYVEGLPAAQSTNMGQAGSYVTLDAEHIASLSAAGIETLAYGGDLGVAPAVGNYVVAAVPESTPGANDGWVDDSDISQPYTFDGKTIADYMAEDGDVTPVVDGGSIVVRLWITPTMDWSAPTGVHANDNWTNGNFELGIEMEGACPIPAEALSGDGVEFAYYMAYFQVYNDGTAARMIGTSCPEDGILNP